MPHNGCRIERVLLVSQHDGLRAEAARLLESLGRHVIELTSPTEISPFLRRQRVELVVIDLPRGAEQQDTWRSAVRELTAHGNSAQRLLALTRSKTGEELKALFSDLPLTNFVVVREDGTFDTVELMVTVAKILTGDIFGLRQYLGGDVTERMLALRSSTEKDDAVAMAETCALEAGCNARVARNVAIVTDELVTNALYNAPVDDEARHIFAAVDRRTPVSMPDDRVVVVRFAWDNRTFGLSTEDAYGSLDWQKVLAYMRKCFAGGDAQIDEKEGGAGIGLYMVFNMVNRFVVNISPGRRSEALGFVTISASYKRVLGEGHSFNLFVDGQRP